MFAEIYRKTSRGKVFDVKCRVCDRRVKKDVNHRFHWVEERMCGLCFWGKIFNYFNGMNGYDNNRSMRIVMKVAI